MVSSSHAMASSTSGRSAQMRRLRALSFSSASRSLPWKPIRFMIISGLPLAASRLTDTQLGMANTSHSTP